MYNSRLINNPYIYYNKRKVANIAYELCNCDYKKYFKIRFLQYISKFIVIDKRRRYNTLPRGVTKTCDVLNWMAEVLKEYNNNYMK